MPNCCLLFVGSKMEGDLRAKLVIKGIGKAGRQPLADLVRQLHPERGGESGLLKLQLQILKKRRVLMYR